MLTEVGAVAFVYYSHALRWRKPSHQPETRAGLARQGNLGSSVSLRDRNGERI
jgi:hypothetical protein